MGVADKRIKSKLEYSVAMELCVSDCSDTLASNDFCKRCSNWRSLKACAAGRNKMTINEIQAKAQMAATTKKKSCGPKLGSGEAGS